MRPQWPCGARARRVWRGVRSEKGQERVGSSLTLPNSVLQRRRQDTIGSRRATLKKWVTRSGSVEGHACVLRDSM